MFVIFHWLLQPLPLAVWATALLLGGLVLAALEDLRSRRIPNRLVLSGLSATLLLQALAPEGFGFVSALPGALGLWPAVQGALLGLALFLPFYALKVVGAGDVKLMAVIGAFLGPAEVWQAALLVMLAGGALALGYAIALGALAGVLQNLRTMFYLGLSRLLLREIPSLEGAPTSQVRLPYAVAIAVGTSTYLLYRGYSSGLL